MSRRYGRGSMQTRVVPLLAAFCLFFLAPWASAEWYSLQSEHFYVHYRLDEMELAKLMAGRAEAVHKVLTARMGHAPAQRTHLVLVPGTDIANGYATPLFENQISIYVTFPSLADLYLAGFDLASTDWITLLLLHEYAHILHLDMQSEAGRKMTAIFGRVPLVVSPLLMAPPLLLEGYAVYQESEVAYGRGRGSFYDMYMRTAVLADSRPNYDQVLGEYPLDRWQPGGHVYFYGYAFLRYLASVYGESLLNQLNEELLGNPTALGAALQRLTGKSLDTLWTEWWAYERSFHGERIAELSRNDLTEAEQFETVGYHALFPTPAPDGGRVAYVATGGAGTELRVLDLETGTERRLAQLQGTETAAIAWHPTGTRLVLAELRQSPGGAWVTRLVTVDAVSGEVQPIDGTEHAFSPAFDPSGTRLAYILRDGFATDLVVLDLETGERHQVAALPEVQLLATSWAPNGDQLALSVWDEKRGSYIALCDLEAETFTPLLGGGGTYDAPAWSRDGTKLYVASDRTGVFNIYVYDFIAKQLVRLTHTVTGLFYPQEAAGGLTAMIYTDAGYRLARLRVGEPVEQVPAWVEEPRTVASLPDYEARITELGPYNLWHTLRPTFWLPWVGEAAGETQLRILTAGQDVLGHVGYTAQVGLGLGTGASVYDVQVVYDVGRDSGITMELSLNRGPKQYSVQDTVMALDNSAYRLGISLTRPEGSERYGAWLAGTQTRIHLADTLMLRHDIEGGLSRQSVRTEFDRTSRRISSFGFTVEMSAAKAWSIALRERFEAARHRGPGYHAELLVGLSGKERPFVLGPSSGSWGSSFAMRGYPTLSAAVNYAVRGTVEGTLVLSHLERGVGDKPLFLKAVRLHPYVEGLWGRKQGAEDAVVALALGAEVGLQTYLGYGASAADWRIGIARGRGETRPHLYLRVLTYF